MPTPGATPQYLGRLCSTCIGRAAMGLPALPRQEFPAWARQAAPGVGGAQPGQFSGYAGGSGGAAGATGATDDDDNSTDEEDVWGP